jgi:indole-3-glycerol phosphate synthase
VSTRRASVLEAIVAAARRRVEARRAVVPLARLERQAAERTPRGHEFLGALTRPGINVIAECKRRSPSRGILRPSGYEAAAIGSAYARAGAAAISVLTEPTFFDGDLSHLDAVRREVDCPLLRKDFIVSEYQIVEARAAGADAVLLIAGAVSDAVLRRLWRCADAHGLAALVEVHDREDLGRALGAEAQLIGVNQRNLKTLAVDPGAAASLIDDLPDDCVAVAESGLRSGADLARLREAGYDAFLIGEHLMTASDPGAALEALMADAEAGAGAGRR